jgi:hypothetical protein
MAGEPSERSSPAPAPAPAGGDRRRSILAAVAMIVLAAIAGLAVVASGVLEPGGSDDVALASPTPTATTRATRTPTPTPTPRATAGPTPQPSPSPLPSPRSSGAAPSQPARTDPPLPTPLPPIDVPGSDPDVVAALTTAATRIADLDAYRFESGMAGRDILDLTRDSFLDWGSRGILVETPVRSLDAVVGFRIVEFDGSAAVSDSQRTVIIGEEAWSGRGDDLEPIAGESVRQTVEVILPGNLAARVFLPFAAAYERTGESVRKGVEVTEYQATAAGLDAIEELFGTSSPCSARMWVAKDGGYLIAAETFCDDPAREGERGVWLQFEITDANDPALEVSRPG